MHITITTNTYWKEYKSIYSKFPIYKSQQSESYAVHLWMFATQMFIKLGPHCITNEIANEA